MNAKNNEPKDLELSYKILMNELNRFERLTKILEESNHLIEKHKVMQSCFNKN